MNNANNNNGIYHTNYYGHRMPYIPFFSIGYYAYVKYMAAF